MIKIYHNPRCSKWRQTLALLEASGSDYEIILYLETPPSQSEVETLVKQIGLPVRDIMRKGESIYKELKLGDVADDPSLIKAIVNHPILLERPIVQKGKAAVICRPPEKISALLT
jgi:arsenate reductase (glutaredoxin)